MMYINNEDAEKVNEIVKNLGVYGTAGVIYEEKFGKLDESACDKFASTWEQRFEDFDLEFLQSLTEEDVERIITDEEEL